MNPTVVNKFPATCKTCSQLVRPQEGKSTLVLGRWQTRHDVCPPPVRFRRSSFETTHMSEDYNHYGEYIGPGHDWGPNELNPDEGDKG
jgi:hypothetical protein